MSKSLSWAPADAARPFSATLLHLAAGALRAASELLTRLAVRVAAERAVHAAAPEIVEFHAFYRDGGAPEGALYVNGELVALLPGVTRL
jgi:hypothetical protein